MNPHKDAQGAAETTAPLSSPSAAKIAAPSPRREAAAASHARMETGGRGRAVRSGKIGMLPLAIREEVCRRLLDGQDAVDILPRLNALQTVKDRMAARFNGVEISPANLSAWRHGGYADWLEERRKNEALSSVIRA